MAIVGAAQFVHMPVEALEFGEEIRLREEAVDHSHRVTRIECRHQLIVGVLDRLHMPGRDITGCTNQSKILHGQKPQTIWTCRRIPTVIRPDQWLRSARTWSPPRDSTKAFARSGA